MRIVISGSHATGKSTLARTFTDVHPAYSLIEEPYEAMVSEGVHFSDPPTTEDYESQLERSASAIIADSSPDVVFERCPIDFLAYLAVSGRSDETIPNWFDVVTKSVRTVDLLVYVPVEQPDRVEVSPEEYPKLRRLVDRKLRTYLIQDELGIVLNAVEVRGSVQERVRQLLAFVDKLAP